MKNFWLISSGLALGFAVSASLQNSTLKSIKNGEKQDLDALIKKNNQDAIWYLVGSSILLAGGIWGFKK